MAVFRHTHDLPDDARGSVVAIGNFDGVHRGHQAVLAHAGEQGRRLGAVATVLTFEPHPRQVFQPDLAPFRLSSLRTRTRVMEGLGLEHLFVLHFDLSFARKTAEEFVEEILVRDLATRHVVVGEDFRFGNKRKGDVAFLREMGERHGFGVSALGPVADEDGRIISSSRVRQLLREGQPREAARLLGRPWEVEGRVDHGAKIGRDIGFPTANVALADYLEPAHGIYAVRAGVDAGTATRWLDGVAYVGGRPTVAGEGVLLETYLFDVSPDLYGQHLRVRLYEFIRGDHTFESLEAMQAQIAEDCAVARRVLAAEPRPEGPAGAGFAAGAT
jgi:riboflavin kinase/FMN adenylyltransferase